MRWSPWMVVLLMAPVLSGCFGDDAATGGDNAPADGYQATTNAPFLQAGYDAARTGNVPGDGPIEYEVALTVDLPGLPEYDVEPLILDGQVYMLLRSPSAQPGSEEPEDKPANALVRVDTKTAEITTILTYDAPASNLVSDGTLLYITETDRVAAYLPAGGQPVWTWSFPTTASADNTWVRCGDAVVLDRSLYVACTQELDDRPVLGDPAMLGDATTHPASIPIFARLSTDDGTVEAQWPPLEHAGQSFQESVNCFTTDLVAMRFEGLSVASPERVLLVANQEPDHYEGGDSAGQYIVYALDTVEGDVAWMRCLAPSGYRYAQGFTGGTSTDVLPAVATSNEVVFILQTDLLLLDLETGSLQQQVTVQELEGVGGPGWQTTNYMTGLATRGTDLWLQTAGHIVHVDLSSGEARIDWRIPHGHGRWERYYPMVAGDLIYALQPELVRAVHAREGRHLWSHDLGRPPAYVELPTDDLEALRAPGMALGDGILVVVSTVGELIVFGRTSLSIQPATSVSHDIPAVGEEVLVDLSETQPGSSGGELEYRADWDEGTLTPWQDSPLFTHTYERAGDREARFTMRTVDSQGRIVQQSIAVVPFDVGGTPPTELNVLQEAFASERQDMTFGVLGVGLAMSGGFVAVLARRSRHSRLQRELAAIDAAAEPVRGNPTRLATAMEERRAHCHGLLVDGKIDESQYTVLEKHIEAVGRDARSYQMRDLFDFLPHGMVTALEDMLADGRITRWERDSFHVLLRENGILTASQKRKVGALIDQWFAQDEATS